MKFNVLTIFPEMISAYAGESILKRAQAGGHISVNPINIRDFATDKHNTVDDTPYGGGAGMIMKPEPIYEALKSVDAIPYKSVQGLKKVTKVFDGSLRKKKRTVYLSPRGRQFDQRLAEEWANLDEITLICGRYEGIDHRIVDHMIDEEVSIGPYVLAGGELGALVMMEAIARNIRGVLGNPDSLLEETHAEEIDAEYAQYTRPQEFRGWSVPPVLLSGDHKKIAAWRSEHSNK
jgi:tRNA (guanine37-N1)-methyltransferase